MGPNAQGGEDFQQDTGKMQFKSVQQFKDYVTKPKSMTKLIPSFTDEKGTIKKPEIIGLAEKDAASEREQFKKEVEHWNGRDVIKYRYNFTVLKDGIGIKCIGCIPVVLDANKVTIQVSFYYCHLGKTGLKDAANI